MSLRNVTVCAGVSGSGKSTFVCRLLVNGKYSEVYIFDPEPGEFDSNIGEYAGRLGVTPARDGYELNLALCRGCVAFDPHTLFPGRMKEALVFLCDWAWETALKIPGDKIIVIDEVWLYQTPQGIPMELQRIVQSGRKRGLHLIVNTQEPNRLNSSITNGVSEFVCFKLQSGPALEMVSGYPYSFDQEEIGALERLQLVARNMDSRAELRGRIKL
jgi:DNA helicase HerA-like ATPase